MTGKDLTTGEVKGLLELAEEAASEPWQPTVFGEAFRTALPKIAQSWLRIKEQIDKLPADMVEHGVKIVEPSVVTMPAPGEYGARLPAKYVIDYPEADGEKS
jgi:hypothetical protein